MFKAAILDDYQNAASGLANWEKLASKVEFSFFSDHLIDENEIADRLEVFDILMINRERTPFLKSQLEKLPNLKLLLTSGHRNFSIDLATANERGVTVCGTDMLSFSTPELAWGLILSLARQIPKEDQLLRKGGYWQTTIGIGLEGKTLGVVGLGRLGVPMARIGQAFGMKVIAWSPNLTQHRAAKVGVRLATKKELFANADFITIHMPLSDRSREIVGAEDIKLMKTSAFLINTSRGPLVAEQSLVSALKGKKIAGAGLDVFDIEPLPLGHPLRQLDNTVLTPHLGYVVEENYTQGFAQMIENIEAWLSGKPIREISD
ncbi:D-2-hydroxyacid dehydrogenase family protein [Gammaproteobacteria bacterium]|nr:D-2-hydroxyacid dehydrogenase family protein [Gammaproteobacteria bacterium]